MKDPMLEKKDRRVSERRQTRRRKSANVRVWLKYLLIAVVTAVVLEVIRR